LLCGKAAPFRRRGLLTQPHPRRRRHSLRGGADEEKTGADGPERQSLSAEQGQSPFHPHALHTIWTAVMRIRAFKAVRPRTLSGRSALLACSGLEFQSVASQREPGRRSPVVDEYATKKSFGSVGRVSVYRCPYLGGQNGNSSSLRFEFWSSTIGIIAFWKTLNSLRIIRQKEENMGNPALSNQSVDMRSAQARVSEIESAEKRIKAQLHSRGGTNCGVSTRCMSRIPTLGHFQDSQ